MRNEAFILQTALDYSMTREKVESILKMDPQNLYAHLEAELKARQNQNNNPLKQYDCDNCGEMTLTPVFAEYYAESHQSGTDYAADVETKHIGCFCSEDCKNEYLSA